MLWLGGALNVRDTVIENVASQTDIATTLLSQLSLNHTPYIWSKNILAKNYKPFAYYAFQNGFGFIQSNKSFMYNTEGSLITEQKGDITPDDVKKGKTYLQMSYQHFLKD